MSQNTDILQYLRTEGELTSLEAIHSFGITRLSARIDNLKKMGYDIVSNRKRVHNRKGGECFVASYRLASGLDLLGEPVNEG